MTRCERVDAVSKRVQRDVGTANEIKALIRDLRGYRIHMFQEHSGPVAPSA